jgi:hypothetical protein
MVTVNDVRASAGEFERNDAVPDPPAGSVRSEGGTMIEHTRLTPEQWEELLADGSVRVPEAVQLSGLGRTMLYGAMAAGELVYFKRGEARLEVPQVSWTRS